MIAFQGINPVIPIVLIVAAATFHATTTSGAIYCGNTLFSHKERAHHFRPVGVIFKTN